MLGPLGPIPGTPLLVVACVAAKKLRPREALGEPAPVPGEADTRS
ncbi:hypothetical protein [Benzoatithermus flavus]|uniref:Uncharacterized protein n=1 Tax=Benzoatithermus flavus TaxID=3108223 RepID=A0ABU8XSN6_9PROT